MTCLSKIKIAEAAVLTRGTSQRILPHIGGFFLFKGYFSTHDLVDDHSVRENIHLGQGPRGPRGLGGPRGPKEPESGLGANPTGTSLTSCRNDPNVKQNSQAHLFIICGPSPHLRRHPMLGASRSQAQVGIKALFPAFPSEICQVFPLDV